MKIKKQFVDLIYNGQKQYEFRNSIDKEGIYKIKDKLFQLKLDQHRFDFRIYKSMNISTEKIEYYFCSLKITEQEYEWIKKNIDYFVKNNETYVAIYKWEKLLSNEKELEIIE